MCSFNCFKKTKEITVHDSVSGNMNDNYCTYCESELIKLENGLTKCLNCEEHNLFLKMEVLNVR